MVTVPSAATGMAVEASRVVAGLIFPQGLALEGRCTSLRLGAPLTPRAGLVDQINLVSRDGEIRPYLGIAWAEVLATNARKIEAPAKTDFPPVNILTRAWIKDRNGMCKNEQRNRSW